MKLCFRSDEPTGGLRHSDQGAVFGLLRPDTVSSRTLASGRTSRPGAWVIFSFVPRIRFRRTRTQRSGTQCNGTRTRWLFELRRCRSLIEGVRGNLRANGPDCYTRSLRVRVRVREEARTKHWTEVLDRAFLICVKFPHRTRSMCVVRASQSHAHSSYVLGPRVALSHRSPWFVS